MPFTRPLEVYVHPLHPPLTPRQLERCAVFAHHFGSTLPHPFIPKGGKPHRDPPPLPFWFPSPDRVISTNYTPSSPLSFSSPATTACPPTSAQSKSPSSDLKSSALPSASSSSSSSACAPIDYSSLQLLPGYSYADGATYSYPPGQRLRLHYLSPGEGAARCRTQVRSEGLRFNASGSRLLVAAREHVLVLNAAAVTTECCIACTGATIVLPHNTHPDLVAVAGQEAYQQSPYVRLYDVRTPQSSSSSSTTRSSSSGGSGGREDSTPVMEMWGPRHDGWWSACWSPVGEKMVCVDRKDVLHVFSLHEGVRKSAARAVAASDLRTAGRGGGAAASPATASVAAASGRSSSTTKRTAAAAEAGDDSAVPSHDSSNSSVCARPKTPFAGTPGGGVGKIGGATAAPSTFTLDAARSSSANFKRSSSTSSFGGPATPGTAASRTSSPPSSSSAATPQTPSPVYVHQLEGIVNACTFHQSGEFLLVAQDNGSLLVLPFDPVSLTDPLLMSADSSGPAGAATPAAGSSGPMSLSLPLHQGGVTCCAADPSGRFVATGGSSSERCLLLLDAESMEVVGEIGRTEGGLQALSFSFDGQFLAWGCRDATAPSSIAVGASGRGSGGDSGGYSGGRSSSNDSSSDEKQETFLTIAGTDPCEIYLQCPTPAAVSAVAFHPRRYICAFATEADTTFAAAQQQQSRQGVGGATFWTKTQHPQQPYNIGFLSFE